MCIYNNIFLFLCQKCQEVDVLIARQVPPNAQFGSGVRIHTEGWTPRDSAVIARTNCARLSVVGDSRRSAASRAALRTFRMKRIGGFRPPRFRIRVSILNFRRREILLVSKRKMKAENALLKLRFSGRYRYLLGFFFQPFVHCFHGHPPPQTSHLSS